MPTSAVGSERFVTRVHPCQPPSRRVEGARAWHAVHTDEPERADRRTAAQSPRPTASTPPIGAQYHEQICSWAKWLPPRGRSRRTRPAPICCMPSLPVSSSWPGWSVPSTEPPPPPERSARASPPGARASPRRRTGGGRGARQLPRTHSRGGRDPKCTRRPGLLARGAVAFAGPDVSARMPRPRPRRAPAAAPTGPARRPRSGCDRSGCRARSAWCAPSA